MKHILIMPDGSRKLFGYCGAKSFSFLIRMAEKKYDDLKAKTGFERFEVLSPKDSKNCEHEFPLIAYSGRTQRSAYCEGELDYFND